MYSLSHGWCIYCEFKASVTIRLKASHQIVGWHLQVIETPTKKTHNQRKKRGPYLHQMTFFDVHIPNSRRLTNITNIHSSTLAQYCNTRVTNGQFLDLVTGSLRCVGYKNLVSYGNVKTRCHEFYRQFVRATTSCFFRTTSCFFRLIQRSENDHLSSSGILSFLFVFGTERKMEDKRGS